MKIPAFAKVLKTPILTFSLFLFTCLFFLLITPNFTKPAHAANYATGLKATSSGCDLSGKVTVIFEWTPADKYNGTTDPVEQILDWAVTSDIDAVVGNTSYWGNVALNVGQSKKTVSGLFAADVDYWWRINTDWGGFLGGWAPSLTPYPHFKFSCTASTINLTASVSGNIVTFNFSPNANSLTALLIYKEGIAAPVKDSGALGNVPSYTWDATGQPAGDYHAQVFVGTTTYSNVANFTLGGIPPPPGGDCTAAGSGQYVLGNSPAISGNNVTFTISSGSASVPISSGQNVILHVINSPDTGSPAGTDSPVSGSSVSWTAPGPGNYCAALVYITAQISNAVPFTVGTAADGDTCSSSALNWANDFRCRAIGGGWFDSDVFTVGQGYATLEFFNFITWGESPANPRWSTNVTKRTGALAMTGNMIASLYSAPPASGVQYFAQKIHDLNPVTPAYAAAGGIGYQTLGPVQKIWIAFRNIAYVGFIIVFVIMGFMIMFRAHISPQAVATVQDSIPRLVIALILVTFSYAIAGFMIDIMFLILNIAIQALISAKLLTGADYVFQKNVFQVIWGSWKDIFGSVASAISTLIDDAITLPGFFDNLFGWVGGTLSAIVIGIAILFIMFRIFLMLLMAYVMIILLTMFAPFFFLVQALPGNNGAKEWFRQMASNIAVFPTVALMFILAGILGGIGALAPGAPAAIQPAQIGQFPLIIGNLNAQAIGQLIGIGFLLVTPSAADIVKNAFGGKGQGGGMGNLGAAAMASIGAGAGVVGAGARHVWSGGGPIADYRRVRAAKQETYRGLIARDYANEKWKNKTGSNKIPDY